METNFAQCMKISPAVELGICECDTDAASPVPYALHIGSLVWNVHQRISKDIIQQHINELYSYGPAIEVKSLLAPSSVPEPQSDLDTPDEISLRSLLLGVFHRTTGEFQASRAFLQHAISLHNSVQINSWVAGIACFELAVLELKEAEAKVKGPNGDESTEGVEMSAEMTGQGKAMWLKAFKNADEKMDEALKLSGQNVSMSDRLGMRIAMLRDEIALKKEMIETSP